MAGTLAPTGWFWLLFFMAVPFCWCSWRNARHLPHGRSQAGDRHLKFYETRDNLAFELGEGLGALVRAQEILL